MELKVNIDTKAVAQQLLQGVTMHLHNAVIGFVQQKFTPGGWNPPFPMQGPGMMPPQPGGMNMGGMFPYQPAGGYSQQQQQYPFPQPQPFPQFQQTRQYYSPELFKNYAELMDKLSADETLITKLEAIVVAHVQEFLDLPPTSQQKF